MTADIDVVHIQTSRGCVISLNGQGHLPCSEHDIDFFEQPPTLVSSRSVSEDSTHLLTSAGQNSTESGTVLPLCEHTAGVYVANGGWTLDAGPESPYHGHWVHGDPDCRKPRRMEAS